MRIRDAVESDLPCILELERLCFEPERCSNRAGLRRSLRSARQRVRVVTLADAEAACAGLVGASVLICYPRTLRVYSLAVHPECRAQGLGQALMADAEAIARERGCVRLSLEADARNARLVSWYGRLGFCVARTLPDYYAAGWAAVRMIRCL